MAEVGEGVKQDILFFLLKLSNSFSDFANEKI